MTITQSSGTSIPFEQQLRLGGIPILPMPEARTWTFFKVWGKITESSIKDGEGRVWEEGEYWTAYGSMIDRDFEDLVNEHGRDGRFYGWEWEIKEEHIGIPKGYIYSTMNVG